jgi:hypothetical protein
MAFAASKGQQWIEDNIGRRKPMDEREMQHFTFTFTAESHLE